MEGTILVKDTYWDDLEQGEQYLDPDDPDIDWDAESVINDAPEELKFADEPEEIPDEDLEE